MTRVGNRFKTPLLTLCLVLELRRHTLFGFGVRSVYHAWGFIVTIYYGVGTDINRREFQSLFGSTGIT